MLVPWNSELFAQAENYYCGVSSNIETTQISEILTEYDSQVAQGNLAGGPTHIDIAVHAVVLTDDVNDPINAEYVTRLGASISAANQFFTGEFSFYLCSYSIVAASADLLNFNGTDAEWQAAAQLDNNPFKLNVYVTDVISLPGLFFAGGVARLPSDPTPNNCMALRKSVLSQPDLFAHEVGHVFGLLHTFNGGVINPDNPCNTSGDRICETLPDPGIEYCGQSCEESPCNYTSGSISWDYTPNRDNLMSYYNCTYMDQTFVNEQMTIMTAFLRLNPNRQVFYQNQIPSVLNCLDLPTEKGYVRAVTVEGNQEVIEPFRKVAVDFLEFQNANLICDPRTGSDPEGLEYYTTMRCGLLPDNRAIQYGPKRDDSSHEAYLHDNGVTTFDLVKISQHILGETPFVSPFQYIAADVNNSGSVTTFDIIRIRKLILGLNTEFVDVDSWRFVPVVSQQDPSFNFWDYNNINPFQAVWQAPDGPRGYATSPSYLDLVDINMNNSLTTHPDIWSFVAAKSGNVSGEIRTNNSAAPGTGGAITSIVREDNITPVITQQGVDMDDWLITSVSLGSGETEELAGLQLSLTVDESKFELLGVQAGDIALTSDDYVIDSKNGQSTIRVSWVDISGKYNLLSDQEFFFHLVLQPKYTIYDVSGIDFNSGIDFVHEVIDSDASILPTQKLKLSFNKVVGKDFLIKQIYPNPINALQDLHLKIEVLENTSINLYVEDEFGHSLSHSYQNLTPGEYDYVIPQSLMNTLLNGRLYYSLVSTNHQQSGILIKIQ